MLTISHAIFSIVIPITLAEVAYPNLRRERWLSNRKLASLAVLLCAVTALGYGFLTPYRPPLLQYLMAGVLVGVLILLAWKTPAKAGKNGRLSPSRPARFALGGFITTLALFLLFGAGPHVIGSPAVLMLLGMVLVFGVFSLLKRYEWGERRLYHKFALAAGALGFFVALRPLQELDTSRLDNTRGMLIVGIVTTLMLLLVRKKLKSYLASVEKREPSQNMRATTVFYKT